MSFSDYYKKWKEDNNVTEEIEYNPNLTQAERNEFIEQSMNRRIEDVTNRIRQANANRTQSTTQSQEKSIWDRVQDISNFSNNSKLMLNNNKNTDYRQSILNAGNRNKVLEQETRKSNNLLETLNNKDKTMLFSEKEKQVVPIKENNDEKDKNENILEDAGSLATLVGLGVSTGGKEVFNYIESANENNFDGYKDLKKRQFLTSQKVNEEDKAKAKIQDNLLLSSNGIKTADENRVETNLVKKAIRDSINKDNEKIQEEQNKISNQGMQTLGKIAPSMGQMLPGMALNAVNPILGTTYFTTSAGGGYIDDALNRGMNEQQAFKYGTVMGALEGASESIITGQQLSKVKKAFTGKEISKKLLNSYGFNIFENAVQEAVMEPAQEITAGIVGDKADWSNMGSRMLESGFNGALMGAISNGVTFGLEKSGNVYDKIKNGENITETEYKEALQENIKKFGKNAVENAMKNGATEVYQEINNIQQQSTQNEQILPTQQITQEQNKTAQNENIEQTEVLSEQERNNRLKELKNIDTTGMGLLERGKIKTEIRALEQGYNSIEEYQKAEEIKKAQAKQEYEQRQQEKINIEKQKRMQLENEIKESTPTKNAQFKIIQNTNPMLDDYHTGIRSPKDIKTFDEVINDEESFVWGDFSKEDAQKALKDGKITIYSSYPIENGTFVSTSKVQAEDYAGGRGNKIYSQEVPLEEVAWINGDEGQYAKVENLANNQEQNNVAQNGNMEQIMSTQNENRKIAIDEINNSRISTQEKQQMIEALNNIEEVSNEDIYAIRNVINEANKINQLPTDLNYKDNREARQKYAKYKNDNSNYDSTIVNEVLDTIPTNRNGRRTVKQWLQVANEIGTRIADKSDAEIEKIAYRSWFEEQPTKNITRYDNQAKTNVGFQKLTSDEWLNTINNAVNEARTNNQAQNNNSVKNNTNTNNYAQSNENNTKNEQYQATKGESINWNEIERPEGKIRKHYRSIIESSNTTAEAKAIAKEMMGLDTYTPQSNESLLQKADSRISTTNPETELKSLLSRVMNNEKVNDVDMAVGERLIEYYSKIGDSEHLQDAIHATALAGTQAGRTVQAMALLNHMTPQGQVVWLERSVNKANKELEQKFKNKKNIPQFELTSDMTEKILNTKSKEEMYKVLDDVYEELGQQVPKTTLEKIDEWRYFSMLANVKTHGRNMIGNVAMNLTQRAKNKVAGAIEGTVAKFNPEMERTHTIVPTSKKVKDFAKNDVKNMDVQTELGMNENKYNPQSRLQSARRTFKSDVLENTLGKMFDLNSKLLEVEDNIGLKSMYVKSLGEYITANKIDIDNMTDAQLSKARQHAIKEAQEATFHQASALATALNQMEKKNNIAKFALDSAVPFKKTPINVAKTGVQYSPVGLIKSAVYDVGKLRKGDITVNQYIDNVSKGLTGTGIAYLGYVLAEAGILKASGSDDDKKEKYEEEQGKQSYSIEIGGKTYSLDWLSPVGIPLFIGAEINQQFNTSKKEKNSKSNDDNETLNQIVKSVANIANASANAMNPMSEMSMISGLTSVLSSYNKENAVGDMIVNTGKSYINQFVPTALGQLARTTDDYERTTKSTKTGALEKAVDSTINQIKSKIPGLRQTLPTKTDIWGKEVKQSENLPFRAFNNFINPSKVQNVSTDKVDKELNSLYAKTGESSIIPKAIDKKYTIDGTDYRMTDKEYAKYYQKYGETSYNLINELISSKDYKNLTDEQKQKAIENVYSYAKESNKLDYAKDNNIIVKESTLYKTMNELKDKGGKQSSYINYMASTSGMTKESEKNEVLLNSNYDSKTKSVIYSNGTGKDDNLYNNIKNSNIDINEYLKYKTQDSNGKFSKEKIYNYVNSNITGYNNKLLILGSKYKLSRSEQEKLANYIYQISTSVEDKNNLFDYYSKNFTIKNGKVYYK